MGILWPHERYHRITEIDPETLVQRRIKAVVLDVDNTLTTHDNPVPGCGVTDWLCRAEQAGLRLIILSNNHPPRVAPFARLLGLAFEADGRKPLPGGVRRACTKLHVAPHEAAVIGDQLFTDILGGRLAGCHCILVDPIEPEQTRFFRWKRRLERPILSAYERRRMS